MKQTRVENSRIRLRKQSTRVHDKLDHLLPTTKKTTTNGPEELVGHICMILSAPPKYDKSSYAMKSWQQVRWRSIPSDALTPSSDPVKLAFIASHKVNRIYMNRGSSVDIMYDHCFSKLQEHVRNNLRPSTTPLIGFTWETFFTHALNN
ncbi:reverse transcriptase domain-containing protein [Artemisia annua]|uniref:Reverse transcriptase domain-containing protein n=1 Tax=Artemisia annua TaxID=35608 RepID=A0A2U1PF49_ARTAN|nr:reverse transcriptase domain-containing protein [Artemisia annua]